MPDDRTRSPALSGKTALEMILDRMDKQEESYVRLQEEIHKMDLRLQRIEDAQLARTKRTAALIGIPATLTALITDLLHRFLS